GAGSQRAAEHRRISPRGADPCIHQGPLDLPLRQHARAPEPRRRAARRAHRVLSCDEGPEACSFRRRREVTAEALLRARLVELPRCLQDVVAACPPMAPTRESFVVTGIGASEPPARAMVALLRARLGTRAAF